MYKNVGYITQNGFTTARHAAMTSWHRPAKRIRHYCVTNSLGGYMHSLSAFYYNSDGMCVEWGGQ